MREWWRGRVVFIRDVRRIMEGYFALRLAFVLEPYGDGLYFPVQDASDMEQVTLVLIITYIPAVFARASRSSRVGWDV